MYQGEDHRHGVSAPVRLCHLGHRLLLRRVASRGICHLVDSHVLA